MALTQINKAGLDEIALDHVFTIGASGSSAYTFQGEGLNGTVNNPTLYLTRGKTYRFENGSGGHPIRIQSTSGASGTAYNTGVTNNAGSGTVIVEVQHDAPDVLYYQCTSHAAMNGILYITGALADGGVTTAKIADDAVNNDKLANSVVASIAANTAKTSNATHTGDVTGSTSLTIANNAVTTAKIADQAVTLAKLPHGTSSNDGKFLRANNGADPTFETVNTDLVGDTSPQLGANLDVNSKLINFGDSNDPTVNRARFGASADLQIYHDGTHSRIDEVGTGNLMIQTDNSVFIKKGTAENIAAFNADGAVELYHDNGLRLSTESSQVTIHRPSSFPNPNNTGSEITGATLDIGGNLHLEERYPNGAYADRQDLVLKTNTGYGQGLNDKVRFSSSGSIFLEVAGSGISFEPHGSSNANLLNDYEEGSFTPTCESGGFNNFQSNVGKYTKIGRMVNVQWEASFQGSGDGTTLKIGGLPFTSTDWAAGSMYAQNFNNEGSDLATAAVRGNNTNISVVTWGNEATGNQFSGYSAWNIWYITTA